MRSAALANVNPGAWIPGLPSRLRVLNQTTLSAATVRWKDPFAPKKPRQITHLAVTAEAIETRVKFDEKLFTITL
jgi:hypothetical protein